MFLDDRCLAAFNQFLPFKKGLYGSAVVQTAEQPHTQYLFDAV